MANTKETETDVKEDEVVEGKGLNIYQKLAEIQQMVEVVSKGKQGYGYTYADINEILAKLTVGMRKYGLSLYPRFVPGTSSVMPYASVTTKSTRGGEIYDNKTNEMIVSAEIVYRWVNNDNPEEYLDVPWYLVGSQSDPSQAMGSALTYNLRYFLLNFFQIAQGSDTDVDAYRSRQKEAEKAEDEAICEQIITNFDATVRGFLAAHEDKKEEVQKFISKYAKNGNYKGIKNSVLAAKLVEDFNKNYIEEESK